MATPDQNSLTQPHSTDQDMQWLPEEGRSPTWIETPPQSQFFLEPCKMGKAVPRGLCEGPCKSSSEEMCEDSFRDPCEVVSVTLCEDTHPWEPWRDPPSKPHERLHEMCKDLPPRMPCEGLLESSVPGQAWLPSIVVEPTEVGEVESGELRWPPDDFLLLEGEDELFTNEEAQAAGPRPGPPAVESRLDEMLL